MDSVKLHPFSIASLTSPEKNTTVPTQSREHRTQGNCAQATLGAPDQDPGASAAPVPPRCAPTHRPVPIPLVSFIPNSLPIDQFTFKAAAADHCVQKLVPLENYAHAFSPCPIPPGHYTSASVPSVHYGWSPYHKEQGLKSPSSKRIKLEYHHTDVSPTSTDSGVSRCNSPGGASHSTSNGSRSSSPIDVLGFNTNDTILAPPVALRKAMNRDIKLGQQRSSSPSNQSDDSGRSSPASCQVQAQVPHQESQCMYSNVSKPVQFTNSRKRPREPESERDCVVNKRRVEDPRTDDGKPVHSYIALISKAILSHPEKRLVLSDIYQYIMDNFPFYNNDEKAWRNSIRHNLSLNDCFVKVGRADNGKGNYWSIHPSCIEDFAKGDYRRRQARRRARTVITPLELQQAASLTGLGIPKGIFPPFGPRSAPPTSNTGTIGHYQPRGSAADSGSLQGSPGYVPMTATTVRDSAFHPYLSAVPNFNFYPHAPHGLVPGFPGVIPPMHPAHMVAAAAAMNMRSAAVAQLRPLVQSPTKSKSKLGSISPPPPSEIPDGTAVPLNPVCLSPEDMKAFVPTSSLMIPGLPGHIPPMW